MPPREVIVVDDGSPDETASVAESVRTELGETTLKIFRQDNLGAGAARNRAVREATSDYLAFLDADDEWLPEKLERSFGVLRSRNLGLVAHNHIAVNTDGTTALVECAASFRSGPDPFVTLYLKGYLSTATLITRRDLVLKAGGFDENLLNAQDFELWLKILSDREVRFAVFDEYLMRYHVSESSIMTNTERRIRCCLIVAGRYATELKNRPGGVYRNLWFRTLIVHAEAFFAYRARGANVQAILTLFRCAPAVAGITWRCLFKTVPSRANMRSNKQGS